MLDEKRKFHRIQVGETFDNSNISGIFNIRNRGVVN